MTIQNWSLTHERATVVCDSLPTDVFTDQANGLVSKVGIVPHLGLIIACKNWVWPAWFLQVELAMSGSEGASWSEVMDYAPYLLRQGALSKPEHKDRVADCRVVLFGFDQARGIVTGALCDGKDWFQPQRLDTLDLRMPELVDVPCDDWEHVQAQQAYDLALPLEDRDNIGGPVIRTDLTVEEGSAVITMRRAGSLQVALSVERRAQLPR